MAKLKFYEDLCKGCGLCADVCPKKILRLAPSRINAKGYHPAECTDEGTCIACLSCARMCPDVVIEIER
ncbi:MAG: 4Fe-4S binding protein [Christensenellaceae bacterium]|jgi:2-oxoglutarate ferredoxin oxidoreductase subunit delta|nr:4Fe-4S binding protein [Christensenellaceae bacterium]